MNPEAINLLSLLFILLFLRQDAVSCPAAKPYTVLDLGSGSGQMTWQIARALPNAHVTGVELAYVPWLRSVLRQRLFGPANLDYKRVDFWLYDCSAADAVVTDDASRLTDGQSVTAQP